jgi:hypothetical protein
MILHVKGRSKMAEETGNKDVLIDRLIVLIYSHPQNNVEKGSDFYVGILDFSACFYHKSSSID